MVYAITNYYTFFSFSALHLRSTHCLKCSPILLRDYILYKNSLNHLLIDLVIANIAVLE